MLVVIERGGMVWATYSGTRLAGGTQGPEESWAMAARPPSRHALRLARMHACMACIPCMGGQLTTIKTPNGLPAA